MSVVYTKKSSDKGVSYVDGISLPDGYGIRYFTADMVLKDGHSGAALQGGRITYFMLSDDDGCMLCLYDDGEWQTELDENDGVAEFARNYFISKWNRFGSCLTDKFLK